MNEIAFSVVEHRVTNAEEKILFFRSAGVPGVEIRSVESSARSWRSFSATFEFLASDTWRGDVVTRRRREELAPGGLFCSYPGDVYSTPRVHEPGTLHALVIERDVLVGLLAAQGLSIEKLALRRIPRMSDTLRGKFAAVVRGFRDGESAEVLYARLAELITALASALAGRKLESARPVGTTVAVGPAERVREYLEHDPSARTDLQALSRHTGLSRFQVLRAFRSSYGLPPHAYKLCVRIGLAQRALRSGSAPAEVAAEYGFVDQSHFTRHFKRLVGVTPLEYASARSRQRRSRSAQAA